MNLSLKTLYYIFWCLCVYFLSFFVEELLWKPSFLRKAKGLNSIVHFSAFSYTEKNTTHAPVTTFHWLYESTFIFYFWFQPLIQLSLPIMQNMFLCYKNVVVSYYTILLCPIICVINEKKRYLRLRWTVWLKAYWRVGWECNRNLKGTWIKGKVIHIRKSVVKVGQSHLVSWNISPLLGT